MKQLSFIKENIWEKTVEWTKGKREEYIEEFAAAVDEKLKEFNIPDEGRVNAFKHRFLSYVFNEHIVKGIHREMTVEQMYDYELSLAKLDSKGIKLHGRWYYKRNFISLKNTNKKGFYELILGDLENESHIEVYFRFNGLYKTYKSVEELEKDMWIKEDIQELMNINLYELSDKELIKLRGKEFECKNNFDYKYREEVICPFFREVWQECLQRGREKASKLTEKELLKYVADKVIYNTSYIKEAVDKGEKNKAIKDMIKYKGVTCSGGTLTDPEYRFFFIGSTDCSTKGVKVRLYDEEKREFNFTWNKVYDAIIESEQPEQIDIFAFASGF